MTLPPAVVPTLVPLGDRGWTVVWDSNINLQVNLKVIDLANAIQHQISSGDLQGVTDVVPSFCSLTVFYDPDAIDPWVLRQALETLAKAATAVQRPARHWRLPVCFDREWAPDLEDLAEFAEMSRSQVCDAIIQTPLRCHAMGFLPGFAYLASLPPALSIPRLTTPRTRVPAQSLAVAAGMAAVYPSASPGGWRLIGQMPVPLFDTQDEHSPSLLNPGDEVTFYAVSRAECVDIAGTLTQEPTARRQYAWVDGS